MKRASLVAAALFLGCAEAASGPPREALALTGSGGGHTLSLGEKGDVVGPALALEPTERGYRGVADAAPLELRAEGRRIQGTARSQLVDLYLEAEEDGLRATGVFAGRLGRLDLRPASVHSTLGTCSFELAARGGRYEGQTACSGGRAPFIRPAALELPARFFALPRDRQLMLLLVLLTR